jgi:hypothetical protein
MRHLWKLGIALTAVAALGVGATTAAADPSERGQGAPGRVCKEERDLTPGTEAYRECVRELAHQRGQGTGPAGQARTGPAGLRRSALRAARQACRAENTPGTAAFRQCVRATLQTNRAARRAARQACLQNTERGTQARRDCLRAAKQLGR